MHMPVVGKGGFFLHTCAGDCLPVALVLHITGCEDTWNGSVAGTRLGDDVAFAIQFNLALDQCGCWVVSNSIEQTIGIESLLLAGDHILNLDMGHESSGTFLTKNLGSNAVEAHGNLRVGQQTLGHSLTSTKFILAHKYSNMATVLGQEHSFLSSRVTTTNHEQWLVSENRDCAIANSAGRDTVLPVLFLTREIETTGIGACGDDDCVCGVCGFLIGAIGPFLPQPEWALAEVDTSDGLSNDLGTESLGLAAHVVHEFGASNSSWETGEVLDIGGCGQLTTGRGASCKHTLVHDGLEFGA
ncbi:hypothetical protein TMatcc_000105 [Talaromyces marneffei ATCC 18224]